MNELTVQPKQKRYYSTKELLRKFGIYLKKVTSISNLDTCFRRLRAVSRYFEWLKTKTIYTAREEDILSFIKYQMSVITSKGKGYSRVVLQSRKKDLHIFYQWLYKERIIDENVFTDSLFLEITSLIRNRDAPQTHSQNIYLVPEPFKEVYELGAKMDRQRSYHRSTIRTHQKGWRTFFEWLNKKKLFDLKMVCEKELLEYQNYLIETKNVQTGQPFTTLTRLRHLCAVKLLYEYLRLNLIIKHDPVHVISLPKYGRGVPHVYLNRHEIEKLFSLAETSTPIGIRDRSILEVLYSTGMRNNELCNVKLDDVLFSEGMIRVMVPKGGIAKQRVIPIGDMAIGWIRKYINESRSFLMGREKHEYVFVNSKGRPFKKWNLERLMKNYCYKGGFKKHVTAHCFRVSCATEMLRHKADIRYVQAQLGHATLQATQIYTRVLPTDLKKVHNKTHPRERQRSLL